MLGEVMCVSQALGQLQTELGPVDRVYRDQFGAALGLQCRFVCQSASLWANCNG